MTQIPTIAHEYEVSSNQHSLAAFDFDFNGALDPVQVQDIATAAFVGRGENLLLVGGPGTGKTVIAMEVRQQATARGLTSEYLCGAGPHSAIEQLIDHGPGYIGSRQSRPGLLEKLLNCDVLLVDEANYWFESPQAELRFLLGRRIELGKSNVLTSDSCSWRRLFSHEATLRRCSMMEFDNPVFLLGNEPEQRSEWGLMLAREPYMPLPQLLAILGIDFNVPAPEGEKTAQPSISQSWLQRTSSPFAKAPVWHQLYTGENNYPTFLGRRA